MPFYLILLPGIDLNCTPLSMLSIYIDETVNTINLTDDPLYIEYLFTPYLLDTNAIIDE